MFAIETKNLIHEYQEHFWSRRKLALQGLDLQVNEGEIFGFLGANGAGKTTTIKVLVGLHKPRSGEARICDIPVAEVGSRRWLGFMPENPYFYEYLTARESMHFYGALSDVPRRERAGRSDELLEFVGMKEAADVRVKEFSKGMRQRLGIAQALVHKPRVVILDEPMSGLDPVGRLQVREAILSLKRAGMTVFFSSHVLGDVEMICGRVGLIMQGRMQAVGPIHELLQAENRRIEVGAENLADADAKRIAATALHHLTQGNQVVFTFDAWDKADAAVRSIMDAGANLRLLRPVRETLEEYFMRSFGKSRKEVGEWSGGGDR